MGHRAARAVTETPLAETARMLGISEGAIQNLGLSGELGIFVQRRLLARDIEAAQEAESNFTVQVTDQQQEPVQVRSQCPIFSNDGESV